MFRLPRNIHVRVIIIAFYLLLAAGLLFLFARYLFWWGLPFLCAYGLSAALEPAILLFVRRLRLSRPLAALLTLLGLFAGLFTLLFLLLRRAFLELSHLILALPSLGESFSAQLRSALTSFADWCSSLGIPLDFLGDLYSFAFLLPERLSSFLPGILSALLSGIKSVGLALPQILLFFAVFFLSSYFFCKDHEKIRSLPRSLLPPSLQPPLNRLRGRVFDTLWAWGRAQLLLLVITFLQLLVGLLVARVEWVVLLAFAIVLLDLLPVVGTGVILLPWSLFAWAQGDSYTAWVLLGLYLCILITRQFAEPQLIGQKAGVYPVAVLAALYVGFQAGGFWGMALGPVLLIVLRFLWGEYKNHRTQQRRPAG